MQVNNKILRWIIITLVAASCIEPFTPDINEFQRLLVINGKITDQPGYQYVEITRSTSYTNPSYDHVPGCNVKVYDDKGNVFQYEEYGSGLYRCIFSQEYLQVGTRYKIEVLTKDGNTYVSDYDVLEPCPVIENIYYKVEQKENDDPLLKTVYGIHLFIDIQKSEKEVSNFRWELDETWEYHAAYQTSDYFDGEIHYNFNVYSDSLYYCWRSRKKKDIITMSTKNFTSGKINGGSLAFIANDNDKLDIKYSVLVRQFSLSDSAYQYWNQMQRNLQEGGGLYETQPIRITGNIHNVDNPEETVLGYFWATAEKDKRFFFKNVGEIPVNYYTCIPYGLTSDKLMELLNGYPESEYPIYLINITYLEAGPWDFADQECFDCRKSGGTITMPDFWQ